MHDKLITTFKKASYKPNPNLALNIWDEISLKSKRRAQLKFGAFSIIGFMSFLGLIPAFEALFNNLSRSGFYEYFSLIFSDGGTILSYWKEFLFSLVESLPTMSIALTLSLICICFFSLKYLVRQIDKGQLIFASSVSLSIF